MTDIIKPSELQYLLNQFDGLEGLVVEGNEGVVLTKDHPAVIRGAIYVHGEYYAYELQVDLKRFTCADDVLDIVGKLKESFDSIKFQVLH